MKQKQLSEEQFKLATNTLSLQSKISSIQSSQSAELSKLYEELSKASDKAKRESINAQIQKKELKFKAEIDIINSKIYENSIKENALEMEVKRLDTKLTAIQKELEKIEEAEAKGIEKSAPNFKGLG